MSQKTLKDFGFEDVLTDEEKEKINELEGSENGRHKD